MLRFAIWSCVIAVSLAVVSPCWAGDESKAVDSSKVGSREAISGHHGGIHRGERKGVEEDLADRLFSHESGHDVIVTPDQLRGLRIYPPQLGLFVIDEDEELPLPVKAESKDVQVCAGIQLTPSASPLQIVNSQRQQLIQSLQALQDSYCRGAKLDEAVAVRNMIQQLQGQVELSSQLPEPVSIQAATVAQSPASPAPLDPLESVRVQNHSVGSVVYLRVTGESEGAIWGGADGTYTSDSFVGMAAVHAGILKEGQTGIVRLLIVPGASSYSASRQHGISSQEWGNFPTGYRIEGGGVEMTDVVQLRGEDIDPFAVYVTGRTTGTVYGSSKNYTDDSDLATAAVHAGLLKVGESGFVMVKLRKGRDSYESTSQNGVTTLSYGSWGGGYRLSAYDPAEPATEIPTIPQQHGSR